MKLFCAGLIIVMLPGFAKTLTYTIHSKGKKFTQTSILTPTASGYRLEMKSDFNGMHTVMMLNKNRHTLSAKIRQKKPHRDLTLIRRGNFLEIKGILNGQKIDKKEKLGKQPWLHAFAASLTPFVMSGRKKTRWQSLRPDTMKPYEFEAARQGVVSITVNGKNVQAVKLKINLTGFYSMFWSSHFYFRKSDGIFVKEAGKGPKGHSYVTELTREN